MIGGYFEYLPGYTYPQPPLLAKGLHWSDRFNRESLTPTGWSTIYTTATTGAGSAAMSQTSTNSFLLLTTAATTGDDVSVRTSDFFMLRQDTSTTNRVLDPMTRLRVRIAFSLGATATTEFYIGLNNTFAALTALPTTARHMGLYYDASVGANFTFTSADGTTQVTEDTTVAADTSAHILELDWTGRNAATLRLYTAGFVQEGATEAVAALGAGATDQPQPLACHFFVQTETTAAKTLNILGWGYECF